MRTAQGDSEQLLDVALDVLQGADDPSDSELAAVEPSASGSPKLESREASPRRRGGPDTLGSYMAEIGRVPLLSAAEEVSLAREVQDGLAARALLHSVTEPGQQVTGEEEVALRRAAAVGRVAAERLTEANLRLVVSIAKRYATSDVPLMDMVQDGNLGLMRAVEKFDPSRGFKFSTYATWWIRQAVGAALCADGRCVCRTTCTGRFSDCAGPSASSPGPRELPPPTTSSPKSSGSPWNRSQTCATCHLNQSASTSRWARRGRLPSATSSQTATHPRPLTRS